MDTTKFGFMRCEFDDDTCEKCGTLVKDIYFRPTVSPSEGQYWCLECINKEAQSNEDYALSMDEGSYSDGSRSIAEFMGDDERVWGYDGDCL